MVAAPAVPATRKTRRVVPIDRTGCPGHRSHGTHGSAVDYWAGCRCPDALADKRRHQKLRDAGLIRPANVDATGTVRRLQGLGAAGWSAREIAAQPELAGWSPALVTNTRSGYRAPMIRRDKAEAVAALVRRVYLERRDDTRTLNHARRAGWVHLGRWADIDDPLAEPEPLERRRGTRPRLTAEDIEWLMSPQGGNHDERLIADLYGRSLEVVQRIRRSGNTPNPENDGDNAVSGPAGVHLTAVRHTPDGPHAVSPDGTTREEAA